GRFREDLYWRLNVVPIVLPPLRARRQDIPLLLNHYVEQFNRAYSRDVLLDNQAVNRLQDYPWPGNVRELANMVERLVIMCEKNEITEEDLPANVAAASTAMPPPKSDLPAECKLEGEIERLERHRIVVALKQSKGVQQKASVVLGITPRQLAYRIRKYAIDLHHL
ncbi:MAG: helix-turn-helix domain-containing protein, partial [Desulfosarcinaceae bacterium]